MPRKAVVIRLKQSDQEILRRWFRSGSVEHRLNQRARIILLAAKQWQNKDIAKELKMSAQVVGKWRERFSRNGLEGLRDAPRSGKPPKYGEATVRRILNALEQSPPKGYAKWTGRILSEHLGDVSEDEVWRVLRRLRISLQRRRSWCLSTDPHFARKAADIVGLYLHPPRNALVLSVDEKPAMQALERAQGWLRLPNGKTLSGFNHEYRRHGTSTLFAALNVATGQVQAGHYRRRRRREFLDFMNEVVAAHPGTSIHVVLDNLNTHKPKDDRWLRRHPQVHFHFTPTHASWLNQIEIWFSILSRQALKGASFTSVGQLREAIDDFIEEHNERAAPFEWTKKEVFPSTLKNNISDLCN